MHRQDAELEPSSDGSDGPSGPDLKGLFNMAAPRRRSFFVLSMRKRLTLLDVRRRRFCASGLLAAGRRRHGRDEPRKKLLLTALRRVSTKPRRLAPPLAPELTLAKSSRSYLSPWRRRCGSRLNDDLIICRSPQDGTLVPHSPLPFNVPKAPEMA